MTCQIYTQDLMARSNCTIGFPRDTAILLSGPTFYSPYSKTTTIIIIAPLRPAYYHTIPYALRYYHCSTRVRAHTRVIIFISFVSAARPINNHLLICAHTLHTFYQAFHHILVNIFPIIFEHCAIVFSRQFVHRINLSLLQWRAPGTFLYPYRA